VASAAGAADEQLNLLTILQVSPPALSLWPLDIDEHATAFLAVTDRERVPAPAAATGHGDEREIAAQQPMQRRAEHRAHDGVGSAIDHCKRGVALGHAATVSQV
jgi:hypothetical protein